MSRAALRLRGVLVQVAACAAAAKAFAVACHLGNRIVLLHGLVVLGLSLAAWGAGLRLEESAGRAGRPRLARLGAALPSLVFGATLLLLLGHGASQYFWGRNLNVEVVATGAALLWREGLALPALPDWRELASPDLAGLPQVQAALGALPLLGFPGLALGVLAACLAHARRFGRAVAAPPAAAGGLDRLAAAAVALGLLLAFVVLAAMVALRHDPRHYKLLLYEPYAAFFLQPFAPPARAASAPLDPLSTRTARNPLDVFVVVLDAARADRMSAYGHDRPTTPRLDAMLVEGRLRKVDTALGTCPETVCSITSLMSSRFMEAERGPRLDEVLKARGYRLHYLLSGIHDWYGMHDDYRARPDTIFDGTLGSHDSVWEDDNLLDGVAMLPAPDDAPAFFYIHLLSAHEMGIVQDRFRVFGEGASIRWKLPLRSDAQRSAALDGYDNAMLQLDDTVARVLDAIEERGYRRRRLVFLVGDHGQAFWEHGRGAGDVGHIHGLYQESLRVPMLVEDEPSVEYGNLGFATLLDIAPTILERIGVEAPGEWEGRSLLAPRTARWSFHRTTTPSPSWAVVHDDPPSRWKHIRRGDGREELYDLAADPGETRDLAGGPGGGKLPSMRRALEERWRSCPDCREW